MFKCVFCGNKDPTSFGLNGNTYYCKKCITFKGDAVVLCDSEPTNGDFYINYDLTKRQKEISKKILKSFKSKKNTLVHAVCGAGKTELLFETISYALSKRMKISLRNPKQLWSDLLIITIIRLEFITNVRLTVDLPLRK